MGNLIQSATADHTIRSSIKPAPQSLQPVVREDAVVVCKSEKCPFCVGGTQIAGLGRPAVYLFDQGDVEGGADACYRFFRRDLASVVDDNHFKAVSEVIKASRGFKARSELIPPLVGRDDDGKVE